jgi:ankyrin repeat protein
MGIPTPRNQEPVTVDIPNDTETLKSIIEDLNRRLQNAQHAISAQKEIAHQAKAEAEEYKSLYTTTHRLLRLEKAKNDNMERRHKRDLESKRSEDSKTAIENLKHDLRLLTVDQQMTKSKLKLSQIQTQKEKLSKLEKTQASQIKMIEQLRSHDEACESLCRACQLGDIEACKNLIDQGVSVNATDIAGFLPIHYAASYGSYEIVKLLLEAGSDPGSYLTAKNPIETACQYGHHRLITLLVEFGGDVNDCGSGGTAPLLTAVSSGYLQPVKELLLQGAVINATDNLLNNCLHYAASLADAGPVISVLLQYGADISATNLEGFTPLQIAVSKANDSAINVLKEAVNNG